MSINRRIVTLEDRERFERIKKLFKQNSWNVSEGNRNEQNEQKRIVCDREIEKELQQIDRLPSIAIDRLFYIAEDIQLHTLKKKKYAWIIPLPFLCLPAFMLKLIVNDTQESDLTLTFFAFMLTIVIIGLSFCIYHFFKQDYSLLKKENQKLLEQLINYKNDGKTI